MVDSERHQKRRESGLKGSRTKGKVREREAAQKAVETKGEDELKRVGLMAAWTRKHGKDDQANPYSKRNYQRGDSGRREGT
jgi:hypothetical protein